MTGRHVVVLAGGGENGGGGLVAARHLAIWGASASVVLDQSRDEVRAVTAHQLEILGGLRVPIRTPDRDSPDALTHADAILDALIGYSLGGPPGNRSHRSSGRPTARTHLYLCRRRSTSGSVLSWGPPFATSDIVAVPANRGAGEPA